MLGPVAQLLGLLLSIDLTILSCGCWFCCVAQCQEHQQVRPSTSATIQIHGVSTDTPDWAMWTGQKGLERERAADAAADYAEPTRSTQPNCFHAVMGRVAEMVVSTV